jgi:hypothetical protein
MVQPPSPPPPELLPLLLPELLPEPPPLLLPELLPELLPLLLPEPPPEDEPEEEFPQAVTPATDAKPVAKIAAAAMVSLASWFMMRSPSGASAPNVPPAAPGRRPQVVLESGL